MTSTVEAERHDLIDTLRAVGPDAPTLCTGWDTRLLLAHLIRRERSVVELGARVQLPAVTRFAESAMHRYAREHSYEQLLETFSHGAPFYSPTAFPPVAEAANLLEYVIHHEDVRRAAGQAPRELPADRDSAVFNRLKGFARVTMRSITVPVELRTPDGRTIRIGKGEPQVTVTGAPVELALVAFGRAQAAVVDYAGEPRAVTAFRASELGV